MMAVSARDQVKTMVPKVCNTFDSHPEVKQRRATEVFFTSKSQVSSFTAYNWTARPSKILLYDASSPAYLLEYTMAASDGLFEEDGVFWFYVGTCQVNASKNLLHTHTRRACTCRAWLFLYLYLMHILY